MAKGGGFGGGGGGFKGGGFKPNGTNFSSYRPKGGARPPSSHNVNMHGGSGGSFLWGALVGSMLNNRAVNNRTNPVYEDGYMKDAPMKPTPKPAKYREYLYCEYCQSEFSDLSLTKCPNCGAKLTRKSVPVFNTEENYANTQYNAQNYRTQTSKSKSAGAKVARVIFIVLFIIVALIIISTVMRMSGERGNIWDYDNAVIDGSIVTFSPPDEPALTSTHAVNELIEAQYLNFKVTSVSRVDEISELGIEAESGVEYIIVQTQITNTYPGEIPIFIRDFSIVYGGENYQALLINSDGYYIFYGSGTGACFTISAYGNAEGAFTYKIENYDGGALTFEYNEFEDTDELLGTYQVDF